MLVRTRLARAAIVRTAALLVAGLVLGLGVVSAGLALPFSPSLPAFAADDPACACDTAGGFAAPSSGTAPAFKRLSDELAGSPDLAYEIVVGRDTSAVYARGNRTRPLALMGMVGVDRRWGFSPDSSLFLTWTLSGQQASWQLYDLKGTSRSPIASASDLTASSLSFSFSKNSDYLVVGAVQGNTEQQLEVYDARAGGRPILRDTAPIVFPAHDPGGLGGESGGPSLPRNVRFEVPKDKDYFKLTWDQPHYHGDSSISGYELRVVSHVPPEGSKIVGVDARHVELTGYTPGIRYEFELRIVNGAGKRSAPVELSGTIPYPKPTPTPTPVPRGLAPGESPTPEPAETAVPEPVVTPEPSPSPDPGAVPDPVPSPEAEGEPGAGHEEVPQPEPAPAPEPAEDAGPAPAEGIVPASGTDADDGASAPASTPTITTALARAAAASAASAPAAASGATSGWGFSPGARYLLISSQDLSGPQARVYDLHTGKRTFAHDVNAPSAAWFFSPCGEALGVVQLGSAFRAEAFLYDNEKGRRIATAAGEARRGYALDVQRVGGELAYYFWADDRPTRLGAVLGCDAPPPAEPQEPTEVVATAGVGRALLTWSHPGAGSFRIAPYRGSTALDPIHVDGRARAFSFGAGEQFQQPGSYTFRITAAVGGVYGETVTSNAVTIGASLVCGQTWTDGPETGTARGVELFGGVRAEFEYTVTGRVVVFRMPAGREIELDAGWRAPVTYRAGTSPRTYRIAYPQWGDYLATVRTTASDGSVSTASAVIHVVPRDVPAGDAFADAQRLRGTDGTMTATTRSATCERGEPIDGDRRLTQWFRYDATADGALVVGDRYRTMRGFVGSSLSGLTQAGAHHGALLNSRLVVPVDAGQRVMLQAAASAGVDDPADVSSVWRFAPRQLNDGVADAIAIAPDTALELTGDLGAASVEPGEPAACAECAAPAASVWYRWTAASDAYVWFHGGDTQLEVYTPDASKPFGHARVDTIAKVKQGDVGFRQEPGREYVLQVSQLAAHLASRWDNEFRVRVVPAPANDLPEDAVPIAGASGEIAGTNVGGYVEALPEQARDAMWRTSMVWYEWTAPAGGAVSFTMDTDRSAFPRPEVLVFVPGDGGPQLHAPVVAPDPLGWRSSRTSFSAEKGQRYLIAATGIWTPAWSGPTEGGFRLHWDEAALPAAPTDLVATPLPQQGAVELAWKPGDDGNADILGYRVASEPALPESALIEFGDDAALVHGLDPGERYELRVAAVNTIGAGPDAAVTVTAPEGLRLDPLRVEVPAGGDVTGALAARGGSEPYRYALAGAPDWLWLDGTTGELSGTAPDQPGVARTTAIVSDDEGRSARREVVIEVGEPVVPPVDAEVPPTPDGGWHDDDTTVVLTPAGAVDAGDAALAAAAVADPFARVQWSLSGAETRSGTGMGRTEVTVTAEGETTLTYWRDDPRDAQSLVVRIDRTAPTVAVTSPSAGARYAAGEVPPSAFTCADALSGVVSCVGSTPAGEGLPSEPGAHSLVVRATDAAGRETTVTVGYTVFAPGPVDPEPTPVPTPVPTPTPTPTAPPADRPAPDATSQPRGQDDGLAGTGGESPVAGLLLAAFALILGMGLVVRRAARR